MGKGFALVYWIQSKRVEILKCQMIPEKFRRENAVVTLKCRHSLTGASESRLAKIVKIDESKSNLENVDVDVETGMIFPESGKKSAKKSPKVPKKSTKNRETKQKKKVDKKRKKAKYVEVNTDSDESSSSGSTSEESANEPEDDSDDEDDSGAVKSLLSSVTPESIKFIRKLLPLMEKAYKEKPSKEKTSKEKQKYPRKPEKIPEEEAAPVPVIDADPDKMSSCLEGFLPPMTIAAIFHRNKDKNDWKKLTTDVLVEIYGKQLAHLSAKGSRGAQGIDPAVYRAIYDLNLLRMGTVVESHEYVRHINQICANRKKKPRKAKAQNPGIISWDDIEVKSESPSTSMGEFHIESADPASSCTAYPNFVSVKEENDKPVIASVVSEVDLGNATPSSSTIDGVTASDQTQSYREYTSESSNQMETN